MNTAHRAGLGWLTAAGVISLAGTSAIWAGEEVRTERLQFKKGSSSAIVQGRIKGYEVVDYLVGAHQGQLANISLGTRHTATYFNLMAPGQMNEAFFNASRNANQYEGKLPATGVYRIRVYMLRSAARRNEAANYRLEVIIGGSPPTSTNAAAVAAPTLQPPVDK